VVSSLEFMKRRRLLKFGLGAAVIGGLGLLLRNPIARFVFTRLSNGTTTGLALEAGAAVCVLTPEMTGGPYYVKSPLRSNITEDRPGLPLRLTIEVVQVSDCTAAEGLTVEIWHCDAPGYYSGYPDTDVRAPFDTLVSVIANAEDGHIRPTDTEIFLRGGQVTNDQGLVEFETIFPGWYDPRLTHIHVKVSRDGETFLTTQLYFPDELVTDIYANHPDYKDHGACPYNLKNDSVLRELSEETGVILKTARTEEQLTASVRFGIS
jgi:protocatechuate 3,4-dioxygenase beta subunit